MAKAPLLVLALVAVAMVAFFARDPTDASRPTGDASSRIRWLESRVAALDQEVAALRAKLAGRRSADRPASPEAPAGRDTTEPAPAPQRPDAAGAAPSAAAWLAARFPDTYKNVSSEEAYFLRTLSVGGKQITDADLRHLLQMGNLVRLDLDHNPITDAGLSNLTHLRKLEHLELGNTDITPAGLALLPAENLRALHLNEASPADGELALLQRFHALETLKLNRSRVTDDGMYTLGNMKTLRHIELDGTAVTGRGIQTLFELNPDLKRVEVRGTGVTSEELARLRRRFPGKEIVGDSRWMGLGGGR